MGCELGDPDGTVDGRPVGLFVSPVLVGSLVMGISVGLPLSCDEGRPVGLAEGCAVGFPLGLQLGCPLGLLLGLLLGCQLGFLLG